MHFIRPLTKSPTYYHQSCHPIKAKIPKIFSCFQVFPTFLLFNPAFILPSTTPLKQLFPKILLLLNPRNCPHFSVLVFLYIFAESTLSTIPFRSENSLVFSYFAGHSFSPSFTISSFSDVLKMNLLRI